MSTTQAIRPSSIMTGTLVFVLATTAPGGDFQIVSVEEFHPGDDNLLPLEPRSYSDRILPPFSFGRTGRLAPAGVATMSA